MQQLSWSKCERRRSAYYINAINAPLMPRIYNRRVSLYSFVRLPATCSFARHILFYHERINSNIRRLCLSATYFTTGRGINLGAARFGNKKKEAALEFALYFFYIYIYTYTLIYISLYCPSFAEIYV